MVRIKLFLNILFLLKNLFYLKAFSFRLVYCACNTHVRPFLFRDVLMTFIRKMGKYNFLLSYELFLNFYSLKMPYPDYNLTQNKRVGISFCCNWNFFKYFENVRLQKLSSVYSTLNCGLYFLTGFWHICWLTFSSTNKTDTLN